MAGWDCLTERLAGAQHSVRLSWCELDALVGGLPPSAAKHRAWWSGDRRHVAAWRDPGFRIDRLVLGHEVSFVRTDQPPDAPADDGTDRGSGSAASSDTGANGAKDDPEAGADILLVTCVKAKLTRPAAAKDLYISELFKRERRYAEGRGIPWFILSAEHGLVAPDEWLAPYERYLPDTPAAYRAAWGRWVAERLDLLAGPLKGKSIEVHAGKTYLAAVADHLAGKDVELLTPLAGLSMGRRLSWYDKHTEPSAPRDRTRAPTDQDAASSFIAALRDPSEAVSPDDLLAGRGTGLQEPGLYSWWVDDTGAADLSAGLGSPIEPGLIYAGLAGATRWPSGRRSTNTLWSRIAGMHLGGRHEFSTFRRTLGSILAAADGLAAIDEDALTAWMRRHLVVRTAVHPDPDVLGELEAAVLSVLDPPLNLRGMPDTPVRTRLTELRRVYGRT